MTNYYWFVRDAEYETDMYKNETLEAANLEAEELYLKEFRTWEDHERGKRYPTTIFVAYGPEESPGYIDIETAEYGDDMFNSSTEHTHEFFGRPTYPIMTTGRTPRGCVDRNDEVMSKPDRLISRTPRGCVDCNQQFHAENYNSMCLAIYILCVGVD